jgi:hypothetical protein
VRWRAESSIRELEVSLKNEELVQQQLKSELMKHFVMEFQKARIEDTSIERLPEAFLTEAVKAATIPIADLRANPAIGNISIGWTSPK